ncbi:MAG TPA: hypothetical protein VGF55_33920 [Gemmataceae bacterium]
MGQLAHDLGPVGPEWEWFRDELARRLAEPDDRLDDPYLIAEIGAGWEEIGLLSQADYIKLRRISAAVQRTGGVISDSDLDWSLDVLTDSAQAVVRARVMGMLGAVGTDVALPAAQRAKIEAAVAPYVHGPEDLDRQYAAYVLRELRTR